MISDGDKMTARDKITRSLNTSWWHEGGMEEWQRAELDAELPGGIGYLELSTRARSCLTHCGIVWISELDGISQKELMRIRNCGELTAAEIATAVKAWSLRRETTRELDLLFDLDS